MSFKEKIDKILEYNTLGISYPSALEEYLDIGTGTLTKPLGKGKSPGKGTIKIIIEKLRINQEWWDTGKGEIFFTGESKRQDSPKVFIGHNLQSPDYVMAFIETIKLLIEKNNKLVEEKNGEITHLRGNETWFKDEFSSLREENKLLIILKDEHEKTLAEYRQSLEECNNRLKVRQNT